MSHITTALISASPPPRLRTFVLAFSVISLLAAAALATPFAFDPTPRHTAAQTTLVDYDTDDDNLIEVSTRAQWAAIDHDRDGDGSPTATGMTAYDAAFPNPMTGNGCASTCIGYELANDLDFAGQTFTPLGSTSTTSEGFAATFEGNGFQIQNPTLTGGSHIGVFATTASTATITGLGVIEPNFGAAGSTSTVGGIAGTHFGKIIGSYVRGTNDVNSTNAGGIVGQAQSTSVIAHSYARIDVNAGTTGGGGVSVGGIIGSVVNGATCINSYVVGDADGATTLPLQINVGTPIGRQISGTFNNTNCTGAGDVNGTATGSIANMRAASSYSSPATNNPFSGFDDTDEDGNSATVDYWDFVGQYDTPVLKAFGHSVSRQAFDYDMDDDGWIDIRTREQWAAMDEDRNGDGIVDAAASYISPAAYYAAFPGAMNTMGCVATDHDSDAMTPDQPTCKGYELLNDIDFRTLAGYEYRSIPELPQNPWGVPGISLDLKGNGYRVMNIFYHNNRHNNGRGAGIFGDIQSTSRIEGLAVWNAWIWGAGKQIGGVIAGSVAGKIVGSYVYKHPGTSVGGATSSVGGGNQWGGLAGNLFTGGIAENSFVLSDVGDNSSHDFSGLFGFTSTSSICKNSYWIGNWLNRSNGGQHWTSSGANDATYRALNCYANNTLPRGGTKVADWHAWIGPTDNNITPRPYATMVSTDDYTGIYENWNTDEDGDGELDDVWDFGDETEPPVLKGYGHDWTFLRARPWWNNRILNLCSRTPVVANEIIRHLKDDTWRAGLSVTEVPQALQNLSECRSNTDIQHVTVNQLADYVVTTPENPIRLDPGRTTPPAPQLTELHPDDFSFLPNAGHFNLSGNAFTTIPNYLFQGVKIRQLDLSDNAITSLPLQAFAGGTETAEESSTVPFAYHNSWIDLSDNRLTSTGIPYRVFDELSHITGLSLNGNAITEVNTRWFDNLSNLGRRDADATSLPRIIGLHLGGNEVSGHYYWHKGFPANMRFNQVEYSGADAGDMLRDAIEARILEPKGLRKPDLANTEHMDLETIENLRNGTISTGACPENLISGPPGSVDLNDMPLQCEVAYRWSPPWQQDAAPQVLETSTDTTGEDGHVVISFSHQRASRGELPVTAYQIRYRLLNEPWHQQWRTIPVDTTSYGRKTATITFLMPLNIYQFQMRAIYAGTPGPTASFAQGTWPEGTEGATAQQPIAEPGRRSIRVTFTHQPFTHEDEAREAALAITGYQMRYRPVSSDPNAPWTRDWHNIEVDLSTAGQKSIIVEPLQEGVRYEFQIRPISGGPVESVTITQTTVLGLPKANSIRPVIREVSVRAGQEVRLEVEVMSLQNTLRNDLADDADSVMIFRWTESPSGGGTFATPSTDRRVVYTAPDLPGTYTILAEAQPDGICRDHHKTKLGISAEDRAPCIATITVRVSRAPGAVEPEADPINPAGLIPTSLTDSAGVAYAVFTPVDGGTFSGEGITVTAPEGAIPDQQLLGVSAARSSIPVPEPFPGARLTIAAPYYEINGVQRTGDAPVSGYTLDDPIRACMPIPAMFRADISSVAVVNRSASEGSITILTSSIRQTESGLAACGNIGQLPATVAVANVGIIEATPEPPAPGPEDLPDTGGIAPTAWLTLFIITVSIALVATAFVRTGLVRTGIVGTRIVGTLREASAAPHTRHPGQRSPIDPQHTDARSVPAGNAGTVPKHDT